MTHSNLKVEVQGTHIVVVLRGTCFRAKYRKQDAPWLATDEYGPDDPDAPMTLSEFRNELGRLPMMRLASSAGSKVATNYMGKQNWPDGSRAPPNGRITETRGRNSFHRHHRAL